MNVSSYPHQDGVKGVRLGDIEGDREAKVSDTIRGLIVDPLKVWWVLRLRVGCRTEGFGRVDGCIRGALVCK